MRSIKNVWAETDSELQGAVFKNECGQSVASNTRVDTHIKFWTTISVDSLKDVDYIAATLVEEIKLMIKNRLQGFVDDERSRVADSE